jgi:hypothetical protein
LRSGSVVRSTPPVSSCGGVVGVQILPLGAAPLDAESTLGPSIMITPPEARAIARVLEDTADEVEREMGDMADMRAGTLLD